MAKKPVDHKARSIKYYEARGFVVAHVESKRFSMLGPVDGEPGVFRVRFFGTTDLFGFADLVVFDKVAADRASVALVQFTSGANHATRKAKIMGNETAQELMRRGFPVHVLSWSKSAGKRVYKPRLEVLSG